MTAVPRLRAYAGPAVLSYGFRPFFLLGSIWAGLEVLVWLPMFQDALSFETAFSARTGTSTSFCSAMSPRSLRASC